MCRNIFFSDKKIIFSLTLYSGKEATFQKTIESLFSPSPHPLTSKRCLFSVSIKVRVGLAPFKI